MRARPRPSLKARAIALLAQREHSRTELRRKLLQRARADLQAALPAPDSADTVSADPTQAVDELLDWLETHRYLSQARFAEARVNARAPRFGAQRIRRELAMHGVALEPRALRALQDSELARALEVWRRKFGGVPAGDVAGRARQARFLAARGFAPEVIRQVVKGFPEDD